MTTTMRIHRTDEIDGRTVIDGDPTLPVGPLRDKESCSHTTLAGVDGPYYGFVCRHCGLWQPDIARFGGEI